MKELTFHPVVFVCLQVVAVECALAEPMRGVVGGATAAQSVEPRRASVREAVLAHRDLQPASAGPERRLTAQERAELRQQLIRLSVERREDAGRP